MRKSFLCSLLLLAALSAVASPRQSPEEAAATSTLADGGHRTWVYGSTEPFQTGGQCKGGENWTFFSGEHSPGSLTIEKCRDGRLVTEDNHTWQVMTYHGAVAVDIDGSIYLLHFPETGSKRLKMILTLTEGSKGHGFEKSTFYYNPGSR
jgi:hypothetical protein